MAWNIVTDFGDSAAMLPAAALLAAWLLVEGRARAAILWCVLFASQAVLVAATKIAFRGWGIGIEALDFTGVSGHSALACSVIPIGCMLAVQRYSRAVQLAASAFGAAAGLAIGVSRVALAQHSWSEVIAGCALGSGVALLFIMLVDRVRPTERLPTSLAAGLLLAVVLLMHGTRASSDRLITRIALHLSGHSAPYVRNYARDPWLREDFWPRDDSALRDPGRHRLADGDTDHQLAKLAPTSREARRGLLFASLQSDRG